MAETRTKSPTHRTREALSAAPEQLAALGRRLKAAGLSEAAVRTCFSVRSVVHVARRVQGAATPHPLPPAAVLPWLFAAGRPIAEAPARRALGQTLEDLAEAGLIELDRGHVSPSLRLIPIAESIAVCPATRPGHGGNPDDSSEHLLGALPRRRVRRWLDLGTGNAFAPLAARGLATEILATDIDEDALACAELGVALSGAHAIELRRCDLFDGIGGTDAEPWDRITFNAPIPGAESDILARFAAQAPRLTAKHGEVLIHARASHCDPWRSLPGELTIARYTPPGLEPAFAILRWRPWAPQGLFELDCTLAPDSPHIRRSWLPDLG